MITIVMLSKNALLLFSKPPIAGLVKTRLTKGKGGNLSEEEASEFFQCCILDIADLSMLALADLEAMNRSETAQSKDAPERTYDFIISTISEDAVEMMRAIFEREGGWEREIQYICDRGASFDEHFDDAFKQLFDKGYDNVVAIGGDHPMFTREIISDAFKWLDCFSEQHDLKYGFVQAPCQESGVSLVGKTRSTPITASGVFYNLSGRPVIDGYVDLLRKYDVPNAFLNTVSDVDRDADLAHAISCINAMAEAARYQSGLFVPLRVLEWFDRMGLRSVTAPNDEFDPREHIDVKA